jgi:hypothetical protein
MHWEARRLFEGIATRRYECGVRGERWVVFLANRGLLVSLHPHLGGSEFRPRSKLPPSWEYGVAGLGRHFAALRFSRGSSAAATGYRPKLMRPLASSGSARPLSTLQGVGEGAHVAKAAADGLTARVGEREAARGTGRDVKQPHSGSYGAFV